MQAGTMNFLESPEKSGKVDRAGRFQKSPPSSQRRGIFLRVEGKRLVEPHKLDQSGAVPGPATKFPSRRVIPLITINHQPQNPLCP